MTIAEEYPVIEHKQIVERALQRKKPFKSDGKNGYRDYLIWRTFIEMTKRFALEDVCFITLNKKDFSDEKDEKKLHPDLLFELDELGIDINRVQYWTSLKEFVECVVKPRLKKIEENQNFIDSLLTVLEGFSKPLENLVFERLEGFTLDGYDVFIFGDDPSISTIDDIYSVEIEKVSNVSDIEYLLEIHLDTICSVDSYASKTELASMNEKDLGDTYIVNRDWNDHYALLETQIGININIDVIYNIEQKIFSTFELSDISDYNCIYCP